MKMRYFVVIPTLSMIGLVSIAAFSAPVANHSMKTLDAATFTESYDTWADIHTAPIRYSNMSAQEFEAHAKINGEAKSYFSLGQRAQFQYHPEIAYSL